jgi:hypothetical protein
MPATPYLTASDARDRDKRLAQITDADIESGVADFEASFEKYCGHAMTTREATVTIPGHTAGPYLFLVDEHGDNLLHVSAVESVEIDEVAVTDFVLRSAVGALYRASGWYGTDVVVELAHGWTAPPTDILEACTEYVLAISRYHESRVSRDVISVTSEAGTTRNSTPAWEGLRPTGFTEVDRRVAPYRKNRPRGIA